MLNLMLQLFFVSFYVQIYDTLSFADPISTDPHSFWSVGSGSALRIRIRNPKPMRIRNTGYKFVCVWTVFAIAVMSFSSVVVSGTDRIRAGARRLQSGQLQVLAAPCISGLIRELEPEQSRELYFQLVNFSVHLVNGIFHPDNCIVRLECSSREPHFQSQEVHFPSRVFIGNGIFHPGKCIFRPGNLPFTTVN
jgi:hypothetical protein